MLSGHWPERPPPGSTNDRGRPEAASSSVDFGFLRSGDVSAFIRPLGRDFEGLVPPPTFVSASAHLDLESRCAGGPGARGSVQFGRRCVRRPRSTPARRTPRPVDST